MPEKIRLGNLPELLLPDADLALIAVEPPGEQLCDRALAAAGLPDDRRKRARRHKKIDSLQDPARSSAGKMNPGKPDRMRPVSDRLLPLLALREIQKGKDPVGSRHPVHRDMKIRPEPAKRQEKLRREEKNGDRPGQAHIPAQAPCDRGAHAGGRPPVGHDIHDRGGVQLHDENFHCNFPEMLRLRVHLLRLLRVRAVELQHGKSLEILEKAVAEARVDTPVARKKPLRDLLHDHDGERDERYKY